MASAGGQDRLSPYQAMGNDPVSSVDPGGTRATQIVDQKLIEFNPSPVIYGQVAVNGPPVGYTPEAMEMMGGYTVFTSDWTEGLSNQVSQQVWVDVGDIFIDINGGGIAVPGIMTNLTMDAGSGSGGDGFSGGDPPSGDDKGDSKSSGNDGTWYGMTTSTELSNTTIFEMSSGYGDKLTISQSQSAIVKGTQGKYYNIDIGNDSKGNFQSLSITNFGLSMTVNIAHLGVAAGLSLGGYHQTFGFSFHDGFGFTSSSGYSNGHADNTLNIQMNPGLYTIGAAAGAGLIITQPELSPVITPFFSY